MKDLCHTCGREIWWLANERTAKPAPIERAPEGQGNVVVLGATPERKLEPVEVIDEAISYRVLGVSKKFGTTPPATGYRSHFASCPQAEHWHDRSRRTGGSER